MTKEWPERLVLVGAGKMGGAMAAGWLAGGLPASALTILEPHPSDEIVRLAATTGAALNPAAPPTARAKAIDRVSLVIWRGLIGPWPGLHRPSRRREPCRW